MKVKGIYKRGEIYWVRRMVNGINHRESLETTDLEEAIKKARALRQSGPVSGDESILALGEKWRVAKVKAGEHRPTSDASAAGVLKNFANFFPGKTVKQITTQDIETWHRHEAQRIAKITAMTYLIGIKAFYAWAKKNNHVITDPAQPVKRPNLGNASSRRSFCTAKLRDKIIEGADNDDLRFILFCGFHAGLRRGEICEVRNDWIDLDNKILWVKKTEKNDKRLRKGEKPFPIKNSNERPIPLTTPFAEFLKGYLREDLGPLDFPLHPNNGYGSGRYRYDIIEPFNAHMEKMGAPHVTPHTMRHTFASLLVQRGISLYKVAKWIGDTEKVTAKHYAHLAPDDKSIDTLV